MAESTLTNSCVEPVLATVLTDFVDPYIDLETGILRNLVGATTQKALDEIEAELSSARAIQLIERPAKITGDLDQLTAIHQRLFQDVYSWAGGLRTVDIQKNTADTEFFMPASRLRRGAGFAFADLSEDKFLRGLPKTRFVDRLAHHYDQVNYLHPFREGNGRTQRVFWSQLEQRAGYTIDWLKVTGPVNDAASRDAMRRQDFSGLTAMFNTIVKPIPKA